MPLAVGIKNMYIPPLADIIATTSAKASIVIGAVLPTALWLAGLGVSAVFLGGLIRFVASALGDHPQSGKIHPQDHEDIMMRGGYERVYDPLAGKNYWVQGHSRRYDKTKFD